SRLEAASLLTDFASRNRALRGISLAAAQAGDVEATTETLGRINDYSTHNEAALDAVRALTLRGHKKEALEIAKSIGDISLRDKALYELAQ
ncbi:MAG TPA: hypothetical protein VN761_01340, partial [Candidatus Polarisedimenticolia bacterium]|nr:hypothetical protein [Candidatus Polarisedimenticolia bacterium]